MPTARADPYSPDTEPALSPAVFAQDLSLKTAAFDAS